MALTQQIRLLQKQLRGLKATKPAAVMVVEQST